MWLTALLPPPPTPITLMIEVELIEESGVNSGAIIIFLIVNV